MKESSPTWRLLLLKYCMIFGHQLQLLEFKLAAVAHLSGQSGEGILITDSAGGWITNQNIESVIN